MTSYAIEASYLAKRIPLAEAERKLGLTPTVKKRNSVVYQLGPKQYFIIYVFGVAVSLGLEKKERQALHRKLVRTAPEPIAPSVTEEYEIREDAEQPEVIEFDFVRIRELTIERLLIIGEILAQSVAMDDVESQVDEVLNRFGRIHTELERQGRLRIKTREVMKIIGTNSHILQFVIARMTLLDKPDIVWEEKELEGLFIGLRKMFELEDRFQNLQFKLNYIQNSSELVLDALRNRRADSLEVTIVILIAFEILFGLYQFFVGL